MIINHNLMAMNTHRQLSMNNVAGSKSLEKLSSGFRINRAGDDAAGLAISEKMRSQIRGLDQASRNAQDGISLIQTAEGALNETHAILQRMRVLAVQSATDTNTDADRGKIQSEMNQLATEITRISNTTEFNTRNLLAGRLNTTFHIGANQGQNSTLAISAMDAFSLGVAGGAITATVSGTGAVTAVTVTGTAAAVVNGSTVTATVALVSGSPGAAATAAVMTGSGAPAAIASGDAGNLILSIDGGSGITIALATGANVVSGINAALGSGATAALSGGILTITSATTGVDSSIEVLAGSDDATVEALGLTKGTPVNGTATGAATPDSYTLTLSSSVSGVNNSVITGLAVDATSAAGTGDFTSFTLTLDGALAAGTNTITLAVTTGSAATFNADGSILSGAVANAGVDISTRTAADAAITTINDALEAVSAERGKLGAMQNRLEHTIKNLDTSSENLQASESRIRDVDMAKEMMEFTKNSILQQAATAMLAQANQAPQAVLQLLR